MIGSVSGDYGTEKSFDGFFNFMSGHNSQSGEALTEWRLSDQVDNDTPLSSPPYWDTDEDDKGEIQVALSALNDAMKDGYEDFKRIRTDPDLANLRKSEALEPLMKKFDESFINKNAFQEGLSL